MRISIQKCKLCNMLFIVILTCFCSISIKAATLNTNFRINTGLVIPVNTNVKLEAVGQGGSGLLRYQFLVIRGNSSRVIQNYGKQNSCIYVPKKMGTEIFRVNVKDQRGKTVSRSLRVRIRSVRTALEMKQRDTIVNTAKAWLGVREHSTAHKNILSYYNRIIHNTYERPRYVMSTYDAWCDAYVSAVFQKAGLIRLSGAECACEMHINLLKNRKRWMESDDYIPEKGDLIFYHWNDNGLGDCRGWANHIGIVVSVNNAGNIKVIEGNRNDMVSYRTVTVNGRYIRGFGLPAYGN